MMISFAKNENYAVLIYNLDSLSRFNENQLKLLLTLAAKADPCKEYTCCPTQEELAEILGWSRSTVQSVINTLLDIRIDNKPILTLQKQIRPSGGYFIEYSVNCFK